jgi:hypothetical protein
MYVVFNLPQICSFPHDNGGRLGWGKRSSMFSQWITHQYFLILLLVDVIALSTIAPIPAFPRRRGKEPSLVRGLMHSEFKEQAECDPALVFL